MTARVSALGAVEDVEGDEDMLAGIFIPPNLKKLGMDAGTGDLRAHVQNFFSRRPDAAITKGPTCFLDALRAAQLAALSEARQRGDGDSPLAWGAFVLE